MVKTLQIGNLDARANFVSKLVCMSLAPEETCAMSQNVPSGLTVYIVSNLPDTPICFAIVLFIFYGIWVVV